MCPRALYKAARGGAVGGPWVARGRRFDSHKSRFTFTRVSRALALTLALSFALYTSHTLIRLHNTRSRTAVQLFREHRLHCASIGLPTALDHRAEVSAALNNLSLQPLRTHRKCPRSPRGPQHKVDLEMSRAPRHVFTQNILPAPHDRTGVMHDSIKVMHNATGRKGAALNDIRASLGYGSHAHSALSAPAKASRTHSGVMRSAFTYDTLEC